MSYNQQFTRWHPTNSGMAFEISQSPEGGSELKIEGAVRVTSHSNFESAREAAAKHALELGLNENDVSLLRLPKGWTPEVFIPMPEDCA